MGRERREEGECLGVLRRVGRRRRMGRRRRREKGRDSIARGGMGERGVW